MSRFLSIRNHPGFRRYFDAVHPLFWPVLYWQLKCAWIWMERNKLSSLLLAVHWWGGVQIVCLGDRLPEPQAPNPFAPRKPRWDDPVWSSGVPAVFQFGLDGADGHAALMRAAVQQPGGSPQGALNCDPTFAALDTS